MISFLELFDVDFFGRSRLLFYFCFLLFALLDALVYLLCLASRVTCCCVFELIFSLPAGYLNPCALSYLLVSCFSLGYCRAVFFVCTVNKFGRGYSEWFLFLVVDGWFLLGIVLIFSGTFSSSSVSATSSYRWYSSYIKSTIMVVCLWCRIGRHFLLPLLWCCFLFVELTVISCWLDLLFRV